MSQTAQFKRGVAHCLRRSVIASMIVPLAMGPITIPAHATQGADTVSPIKHVIVIIGENRTFDHVFATYQPAKGESVDNLLSKGIVNVDGTPGPQFHKAVQRSAIDLYPSPFEMSPGGKADYATLPPPVVAGPTNPHFTTAAPLASIENGLPSDYLQYLTTGGTGLPAYAAIDTRIPNATALPPGPYSLTSSTLSYDAYSNSPVHRFYQMWQQMDCRAEHASKANPSGCRADLFPWVEVTVGAGTNGQSQADYLAGYYIPPPFNGFSTGEGSTAMAFYNVAKGDAPYFKSLADQYAMSDNYHQGVMGGTGANHVMIGMGDAIWFSDGNGNPATPPSMVQVATGSANQGIVDEIENPDPAASGGNNWYTQDGYGNGGYGAPASGGGTYSNCSDQNAPGVKAVLAYLGSLPKPIASNCEQDHYYLLNNYNPGYFGDGSNAYTDNNDNNTPFTIPPSNLRHIGDALSEKGISFAYFGDQWNAYLNDKYQVAYGYNYGKYTIDQYCNICNFFQYTSSIMSDANARAAHLKDTTDLYAGIQSGQLPAVSFVKPSGLVDGHPASSKLNLFEGFVKKIIDGVKANPQLWKDTAILVTFDEGGGYYDSGYVQPVDFFGDGTRVPFIAVSPFTKAGHISHDYTDHASILKFIERNWKLAPLTHRSRDNLPNPVYGEDNHYAPVNTPAIGDLFDLFVFDNQSRHGD